MKNIFVSIVLFIICLPCRLDAQQTYKEEAFIRSLLKKENYYNSSDIEELNETTIPYSVSLTSEKGIYTVSHQIIAHEDFNDDGISDYLIFRSSQGTRINGQYIYYIMKNNTDIYRTYTIYAYNLYSSYMVKNPSYNDRRFYLDIGTNTFRNDTIDYNFGSTRLSFVYKDNNLYEESYLSDCIMAKMKDKSIFIPELKKVNRELNIEPYNYTEVALEEYENDTLSIYARMYGCDNLGLHFSVRFELPEKNTIVEFENRKRMALNVLNFLKNNTQYSTLFEKVLDQFEAVSEDYTKTLELKLDDNWYAFISPLDLMITPNPIILIQFDNRVNKNQYNRLDVATRKK